MLPRPQQLPHGDTEPHDTVGTMPVLPIGASHHEPPLPVLRTSDPSLHRGPVGAAHRRYGLLERPPLHQSPSTEAPPGAPSIVKQSWQKRRCAAGKQQHLTVIVIDIMLVHH